jgi:crotonobetainyl-CoA:carnitine CoA-transferase CaiB-like acyl-CoA transferase
VTPPPEILAGLWRSLGLPADALRRVSLGGSEPVLPSSFRVDALAQVTIAAVAAAAALLWRERGGTDQDIAVDIRAAAAEFRSERMVSIDGAAPRDPWDPIAGAYRCGDGRWVRLHTNFAHHRDGVLKILGCANDRNAVQAALATCQAEAFENAATGSGMVVAMMRSFAEWDAHPHSTVIAGLPLIEITRMGDAPPAKLPQAARPLGGVRVLEMTRIIAGPIAGRALAAHGADVLRVIGPDVPTIPLLDIDSGRGKRSAHVDLRSVDGREALRRLAGAADVFLQGYRPGAIAGRGFSAADVARLRPGIVYASLSAYGEAGPWGGKRGFDSLVQTATGFNHAEGQAAGIDGPKPLPCQALDHASGYLLALGAIVALHRRATQGGSWHVKVSLARTAHWLRQLGRLAHGLSVPDPKPADLVEALDVSDSGYGKLHSVPHAAGLTSTPARWTLPSMPYGTHEPEWPKRVGAWSH